MNGLKLRLLSIPLLLLLMMFAVQSMYSGVTVYPTGTTIYVPEKCYNGYTVFSFEVGPETSRLINMNGTIVNEWNAPAERAKFLPTGNLITVRHWMKDPGMIEEYDWEHNLVWHYQPSEEQSAGVKGYDKPGRPHHDVQRLANGNTLVLYREVVPESFMKHVTDPRRRKLKLLSDAVVEVTPDKKTVWEWHAHEHMDINMFCSICDLADWTHSNTVQALPENKWYERGDKRFKPGNVLISPRSLDTIFLIDRESKEVVWQYTGNYRGGLSGQHEPHMIEKGLPGAGNIIIFDNGASPLKHVKHSGESYILEINPVTEEIVWKYENGEKFYSKYRGTAQRLPNGNTLINEADGCRIFEVTVEGEIVWEYVVPYPQRIGRAHRYPYDYAPQLKALGKPREVPVEPPPDMPTKALNAW